MSWYRERPEILRLLKSKIVPQPIEGLYDFNNLSQGCWVYAEMLETLRARGWVRFAPGFKSALYGHPREPWCLKIMGMGVGDNPGYFFEMGCYLRHERGMLEDFQAAGFDFQPAVMPYEETVRYLRDTCGLSAFQAELRARNHDVLVMEYIPGLPCAVQTGHNLDYDLTFSIRGQETLFLLIESLQHLQDELRRANHLKLLHNDPMPPNILFTRRDGRIRARLVDFELAQNLLRAEQPEHVSNTVRELYRERNVPVNPHTGVHLKNLDQHILDEAVALLRNLPVKSDASILDAFSLSMHVFSLNLGKAARWFR